MVSRTSTPGTGSSSSSTSRKPPGASGARSTDERAVQAAQLRLVGPFDPAIPNFVRIVGGADHFAGRALLLAGAEHPKNRRHGRAGGVDPVELLLERKRGGDPVGAGAWRAASSSSGVSSRAIGT